MKIASLRDVKANLSAVLFPVTEDTDIESMVLAQNKEFWQLMDRARKEGEKKGFTEL